MNHKYLKRILLLFIVISGVCSLQAQSLESARSLYNQGKYEEARDIFAKQIKNYRYNASVNHWYGVSLYKTGFNTEAEKYLKVASSRKIQESFRYLGEIQALDYRYDEAIENFELYKEMLEKGNKPTEWVDSCIAKARVGERLFKGVELVQIIDSIVVDKATFLENYILSAESGRVVDSQTFDHTAHLANTSIFQTQRGEKLIYGMPSSANGQELVSQTQLIDGSWDTPTPLSESINTPANESYPYMLSDGVTLYFASDGEESMGGYDIFVTRLNLNTGKYLTPENVGMPFNSPYNDYMLAIDETLNVGWFATDRYQPEGKVVIYLFIPNKETVIYKGEDAEVAKRLARIDAIKETWRADNYDSLIERIYHTLSTAATQAESKKKSEDAFTFVVNDLTTYNHLSDFTSEEAKNLYIKASEAEKRIEELEQQLEQLRNSYHSAPDAKSKNEIIALERQLLSLYGSPNTYYKGARRAEAMQIKRN